MIDRFLSDRGKWLKLTILGLIFAGFILYGLFFSPVHSSAWQQMIHLEAGASLPEGQIVSLSNIKVLRRLPGGNGVVMGIGPDNIEIKLLGEIEAVPGDHINFRGPFQGDMTLGLLAYRVHATPRRAKLGFSLLAAVLALALVGLAFRFRPSRQALFWPRD